MNPRTSVILAVLVMMCFSMADSSFVQADDLDQKAARRAVERGELRPLSEILAVIAAEFGGKVLEVELEREDSGELIYEIEILSSDGRVLELEYDGRTGKRLSLEEDD